MFTQEAFNNHEKYCTKKKLYENIAKEELEKRVNENGHGHHGSINANNNGQVVQLIDEAQSRPKTKKNYSLPPKPSHKTHNKRKNNNNNTNGGQITIDDYLVVYEENGIDEMQLYEQQLLAMAQNDSKYGRGNGIYIYRERMSERQRNSQKQRKYLIAGVYIYYY